MQQYCELKGKPRTHEPIFNVQTAVDSRQLQVRRTDLYWAQYISSIAKKAHQCFYLHLGLRGFNTSLNIKVAQVYSGEHTDWVQHGLVRVAAENFVRSITGIVRGPTGSSASKRQLVSSNTLI